MLTELYRQLIALLKEAGVTAYAVDAVPPDAAFPFIALEIRPAASLHGLGRVTLTGWLRSHCRHADRLALADTLLSLVPPGGRRLLFQGGIAVLYQGSRMNVEWLESSGALGVRIRHELRVMGGDTHV